ncbi:D-alanyl-D-alanine carboxypeptidase family protein [Paenibacillus sp. CECT 9249]|uniref:D-alanyl-D-alanine carboxypeptidase family protein n=1 Tax=Paenibacillus sp. CECT 9249 TaxID=2845385 RepID=UPI001E32733A|nr:D-alanyl-D-alanine carboxypeptidase family protein [Paenibacillus sp. CECT 9249]
MKRGTWAERSCKQLKQSRSNKQNVHKRSIFQKSIAIILLFQMLCISIVPAVAFAEGEQTQTKPPVKATAESLGLEVSSAILMEATTGQILFEDNADVPLPPASMTKMMSEYIVAEQVKQGKLSWDEVVTVGEHASLTRGSRIFLAQGDQHTVEELYIAMAVGSANDATVALAERVAGTEAEFVKMMNETAKEMGMKTAHFINSTGLDRGDMPEKYRPAGDDETVLSARDAAILAQRIVTDHPDFSKFTAIQQHYFRPRDKDPIINLNWMLESNESIPSFKRYAYKGLDGLKTGHTKAAGYCFAGTAERDGMRLISVVMGAKTEPQRFIQTKKVLDYGFENFALKTVISPKSTVEGTEKVKIKKGVKTEVPVVTQSNVNFVVPKNGNIGNIESKVDIKSEDELVAPIQKEQVVGTVTYTYNDGGAVQEKTVNLIATEDVDKGSWWRLFFRAIKDFFVDMFNGIKNLF